MDHSSSRSSRSSRSSPPAFPKRLFPRILARGRVSEPPIRAAEAAWRVLRLCAVAIESRAAGWCLGPIGPGEVEFVGVECRRPPARGRLARRRAVRSGLMHERDGHGAFCTLIGIPEESLRRLIEYWSPPGCAEFLAEAVAEAVAVLRESTRSVEWNRAMAREAVEGALSERISIRAPVLAAGETSRRGRRCEVRR